MLATHATPAPFDSDNCGVLPNWTAPNITVLGPLPHFVVVSKKKKKMMRDAVNRVRGGVAMEVGEEVFLVEGWR